MATNPMPEIEYVPYAFGLSVCGACAGMVHKEVQDQHRLYHQIMWDSFGQLAEHIKHLADELVKANVLEYKR